MAKKILAVVLAVMMAVSAMAISVAADQTIPLYKTSTSQSSTWGFEFTIPIFTQYGWGTQYDGFELVLPENVSSQLTTSDYKYYITVNGQRFDLKPSYAAGEVEDGVDANGDKKYKTYAAPKGLEHAETHEANWNLDTDTYKQYVFFGAFVHSYFEDGQHNEQWTTVPQTQTFGATTSIKVGIEFNGNAWDQTWKPFDGFTATNSFGNKVPYTDAKSFFTDFYSPKCYAQFITYDGESNDLEGLPGYAAVPNSVTYMSYWNPVQTGGNNDATTSTAQDFVSGDLYTALYQDAKDENTDYSADKDFTKGVYPVSNPLTWDHNLANRAIILGYAGDHAELVVETDKPLNGIATYTLYTRAADNGQYTNINGLWWNYNTSRIYVDSKTIDGTCSELRFDVPLEYLFDSAGYGNYNSEFVILETIGLYHRVLTTDCFTVVSDAGNEGSIADFAWNIKNKRDAVSGRAWAQYKGEYINYAAGGVAFPKQVDTDGDLKPDKDNPNYYTAVKAEKIYLNFPEVEDSEPANDDEVKTPTEPADGANDPDSGDDMSAGETDNTPAEKNPETGIALAIVPMLVAAAAAVVSKKH